MKPEKKIRKYVGPSMWIRALSWATLAAAIVSLLMCTAFRRDESRREPALFDPYGSGASDYVYLDVVGVSDWALKRTSSGTTITYYFALDPEGYAYVLVFTNDDLDKMSAQRGFWDECLEGGDSAVMSEPFRVYGSGRKVTADVKGELAEYLGISEEDFDSRLGTQLMSVGNEPSRLANELWTVSTVVCALACFAFSLLRTKVNSSARKCIAVLRERGLLEQAAAELDAESTARVSGDCGRASENFIFGRGTGAVMPYGDVIWAFISVAQTGVASKSYLVLSTAECRRLAAVDLGAAAIVAQCEGETLLGIITEHAPDVIVGFSKENERACRERRAKALAAK